MKKIEADFSRYVELEGVGPVSRPVDIDQSLTGFAELRTLRIYRFETGSVIDGHAEEDEVFLVVLSGAIELTMSYGADPGTPQKLAVAGGSGGNPCAAYMPPHAAYRLVPYSSSDIAYVRARPNQGRAPRVFAPSLSARSGSAHIVFEETRHAEKLRVRLTQFDPGDAQPLLSDFDGQAETLIHVRDSSAAAHATLASSESSQVQLQPWDTVAVFPGERPQLHTASGRVLLFSALAIL